MSTVATGTAKSEYRQFIAGQWVDASDGGRFDDLDPYTGEVVATAPAGTREDALYSRALWLSRQPSAGPALPDRAPAMCRRST